MIAFISGNFAAEHVVAPCGVNQNHRNDEQGAYQHKELAGRRRGSLPQRDMRWNDIGPQTDTQTAEAEKNEPKRQEERTGIRSPPTMDCRICIRPEGFVFALRFWMLILTFARLWASLTLRKPTQKPERTDCWLGL